jgi:hypothetical protein
MIDFRVPNTARLTRTEPCDHVAASVPRSRRIWLEELQRDLRACGVRVTLSGLVRIGVELLVDALGASTGKDRAQVIANLFRRLEPPDASNRKVTSWAARRRWETRP